MKELTNSFLLRDLQNQEVTVLVAGLQRPCGGWLVVFDDYFISLESSNGNTITIPHDKILSILSKTSNGGNNDGIQPRRKDSVQ